MKHCVIIENIPPASPESFHWMTQKSWERFQCSNRGKICSHFVKKILFCNSTNNLKQKESSASFFNCFLKLMVTGVFWWVLNILHFAHYFYLYWIGVIFFFLSLFKNLNIAFFIICFTFSRRFKIAPCRSKGPNIFFEFIRNFEKSEMSKLLLMNKNINNYVP